MSSVQCANPNCSELGKSKCAACGLVSYCGSDCQKSHWQQHKGPCKASRSKSSGSVSPATSPKAPTAPERLQILKSQIQASFQQAKFPDAIKLSHDAISVAKEIPEPGQYVELIQLYLNLSSAHLQINQAAEADQVSELCVEVADRAAVLRGNHPQAIDMLSVSLNNRAFIAMNLQRLDVAEQAATRAHSLAETIFPKLDIRLFKVLRTNGLIKAKLEKIDEAEKFLRSAFFISNKSNGPCHQDTQQSLEELLQILMRKEDVATAEAFAKKNYESMIQAGAGDGDLLLGEAAAIYASILAKVGKAAEAEPIMRRSLAIREKVFGPGSQQVSVTLMALANILEALKNVGAETEGLLVRAIENFKRLEGGVGGQHTMNAVGFLQRVRAKREGILGMDDDIDRSHPQVEELSSSPSPPTSSGASSPKTVSSSSSPKSAAGGPVSVSSPHGASSPTSSASSGNRFPVRVKDDRPMPKFDPADGVSRMKFAAMFFETQQFSKAEILLREALEIFLKEHGPQHPTTMAAKQNLEIVKHNALTQLWQEVVVEELEKMGLGQGDEEEKAPKTQKDQQADLAALFAADPTKNPKGASEEDAWLYKQEAKGSCTLS